MGLCVDEKDTKHRIAFEIRSHSVIFNGVDIYPDEWVEINKEWLAKLRGLLNDPDWCARLTNAANEPCSEAE